MSKEIDTIKEKAKRHDLHKPAENFLLNKFPEQLAGKMKNLVSKSSDTAKTKSTKKAHENEPQFIRMTPLYDHSLETKAGIASDNTKTTKPAVKLFRIESQREHELTPDEMKALIPKLQNDVQTLQTFCLDTMSTISGREIYSTADAISVAQEQAELKSKGEQLTLRGTAEKHKLLLAELHSPNVIAAFNDLAGGINNNYLPTYMKTPTQAWDEAQKRLPKAEKLLNLVDSELTRQRTTPGSLCRLLARTIFVSNELDHFHDELDRVTCNDRVGKTKEEDAKERTNAAEYKKLVDAQLYQLDVINRNFELAQTCENINRTCWDFGDNLYSDWGNASQIEPEKQKITMLIDNFYKQYSAEQIDRDCRDEKLTDKQRNDIASLKEAMTIILPYMAALKDDCQTGQILNQKRYKAPDFSKAWTNLCVGDWKHGHRVNNLDPLNKLSSDSFDKQMEIDDIARRFQH